MYFFLVINFHIWIFLEIQQVLVLLITLLIKQDNTPFSYSTGIFPPPKRYSFILLTEQPTWSKPRAFTYKNTATTPKHDPSKSSPCAFLLLFLISVSSLALSSVPLKMVNTGWPGFWSCLKGFGFFFFPFAKWALWEDRQLQKQKCSVSLQSNFPWPGGLGVRGQTN